MWGYDENLGGKDGNGAQYSDGAGGEKGVYFHIQWKF
jgi:hypothetical protein